MAEERNLENTDNFAEARKFIGRLLRRWYWIVGSVLIALTLAYLFNRYEDPIYVVKASFITKKFDQGTGTKLDGVLDGEVFRQQIEVNQEIPLLKSQSKIDETLSRLNFGISYYVEGNLKTAESYQNSNYTVHLDSSENLPYNIPIFIDYQNGSSYQLSSDNEALNGMIAGKNFIFNEVYNIRGWRFYVQKNQALNNRSNYRYYFVINHPSSLVNEYRSKLNISWAARGSAILNSQIQTTIPKKDLDFMQSYLQVVIEKGLEEKNEYLTNTVNFIDNYMNQIADTLMEYQDDIDDYKLENSELINGSSYIFNRIKELDQQKTEILLSNQYYDYITDYIKEKESSQVFAPNLIGLDAPLLDQLIQEYISMKWEDKVDANEFNEKNPLVNRANDQYQRIEDNIFESITNLKQANRQKLNEINNKIEFFYNSVQDFQVESRNFSQLQRMFGLYENVYNDLLTRRTSANIARASTVSDYQIVTPASFSNVPIYPDKNKNYLIALAIGLGLPIGLIYVSGILNNKIITKDDLSKATHIPIIGNIGHSLARTNLVVKEKPKSYVSESFRGIRANLQYFSRDEKNYHIYLITSSISGEGKTFCSINLAYTFALAGKKTIIVGGDMRKPTLANYFNLQKNKGLSNYLAGFDELKDVITITETEKLHVITGGDVPPNPAELVTTPKMKQLVNYLKKEYEIIIIDTPPIGLVSDTLELLNYSDSNLLVVRQGRTFKSAVASITEMYQDGKIQNLGILFNDINFHNYDYGYGYRYGYGYGYGGYGYGYGYGNGYYEEEKPVKSWFKRLIGKK